MKWLILIPVFFCGVIYGHHMKKTVYFVPLDIQDPSGVYRIRYKQFNWGYRESFYKNEKLFFDYNIYWPKE